VRCRRPDDRVDVVFGRDGHGEKRSGLGCLGCAGRQQPT
jgi:hypothetical protein